MTNNLRNIPIRNALISVYHKEGLAPIIEQLAGAGVQLYSTGGSLEYIRNLGADAIPVEDLTGYPSILGGRVKTLHPKVFGGILSRRDDPRDKEDMEHWDIGPLDLVIVDLYPFDETVASGASHSDIIEKIDIGGISLIRAAAKNYRDVMVVPDKSLYAEFLNLLQSRKCQTTLSDRMYFASQAFKISSHYDTGIFRYFNKDINLPAFSYSLFETPVSLRYGENPHQGAMYFGQAGKLPKQLHGKEISYNNLLDIEAALRLISDFDRPAIAILKHNNACGCSCCDDLVTAWEQALKADPASAFGGIIVVNRPVTEILAHKMDKLFFEIVLAPSFEQEALEVLKSKKNRIILVYDQGLQLPGKEFRSLMNGVIVQDRDISVENVFSFTQVTHRAPSKAQLKDLVFANKLVKHTKSNAIVLAANEMLLASGMGQTSRVDALKHAIEKARENGLSLKNAVMASDAFFPFPDCVELAHKEGITAVVQPGGSIKDQLSIDYCNVNNMAMVFTGIRHFKH
ncbi:MAG: Bifunctional purine biosynthesis protein PurH [Bacteroidetes bacterium ADurb.Bin037]|nr:MAG: Bifunctional purine biosynthesis protein PurH [Bacteroidetes bacterium ADurb.Bin037]HPW78522.1 bifunctional phosphoribosylaminoimidazolecarboxamide formyltransferase/IMP cyclohydrolase [Bacteroidales bacterium]HQB55733.1 bifunctional phosphoribosylaminoimidazolecarboxamide formyltransferase/IMP cyclohydrolase [Bacteroidales bacterium]